MLKKVKIIGIDNYIYTLEDNEKLYKINIEIVNIEKEKIIDSYIYLYEEILRGDNFYTYGKIEPNNVMEDKDIVKLETKYGDIYLQRYYG